MSSDRELDAVAEAIDDARDAARAERDSRPFDGSGTQGVAAPHEMGTEDSEG
jgi:hypothetical protein